jgi:hypothetical protein
LTSRAFSRRLVGLTALVVLVAAAGALAGPVTLSLPRQMAGSDRARLQGVADAASVSTRVDAEPFMGRRDVFEYLLDHPELATHVTRALRLARYRIWRQDGTMWLDDGWGAVGQFFLLYSSDDTRVMYAKGRYRHKILPDITGEAVVVIEYAVNGTPEGRDLIRTAVTGFVKLDSRLLASAGRLVNSVAAKKADKEARRLVRVFARATNAVEANPTGVLDLLRQRPDVPGREMEEFRQLLARPAPAAPPARPVRAAPRG